MVLIRNLLLALVKIIILLVVITFEKVVGLPIIFVTLSLLFFINVSDNASIYKYIYLISSSLLLAIVYNLSFSLSLLVLVFLILGVNYGKTVIFNDINRVLLFIYIFIIIIALISKINWGVGVVGYFIISSLAMLIILMKTLFSKYGLEDRISGKKGNYFR